MNVQELIDALIEIKDKSLIVLYKRGDEEGDYETVDVVLVRDDIPYPSKAIQLI